MRSKFISILAITVAAALLSGCGWVMTGFTFSDTKLKEGEAMTVSVKMRPARQIPNSSAPFFMLGLPNDGELTAALSSGKNLWDTSGKFDGPKPLEYNVGLTNYLLTGSNCDDAGLDLSSINDEEGNDMAWLALVRKGNKEVNNQGKPSKVTVSKLRVKVQTDAADDGDKNHRIVVIGGGWADDGDEVPESGDDDIRCQGAGLSAVYADDID